MVEYTLGRQPYNDRKTSTSRLRAFLQKRFPQYDHYEPSQNIQLQPSAIIYETSTVASSQCQTSASLEAGFSDVERSIHALKNRPLGLFGKERKSIDKHLNDLIDVANKATQNIREQFPPTQEVLGKEHVIDEKPILVDNSILTEEQFFQIFPSMPKEKRKVYKKTYPWELPTLVSLMTVGAGIFLTAAAKHDIHLNIGEDVPTPITAPEWPIEGSAPHVNTIQPTQNQDVQAAASTLPSENLPVSELLASRIHDGLTKSFATLKYAQSSAFLSQNTAVETRAAAAETVPANSVTIQEGDSISSILLKQNPSLTQEQLEEKIGEVLEKNRTVFDTPGRNDDVYKALDALQSNNPAQPLSSAQVTEGFRNATRSEGRNQNQNWLFIVYPGQTFTTQ